MKKPLFVIFNDTHLKVGNEKQIIKAIKSMVKYCTDNDIEDLMFAGDLFDSRKTQRLSTLLAFDEMLKIIDRANLKLTLIPGNHDKTKYNSMESFLDIFENRNMLLYDDLTEITIKDTTVTFLPFFTDEQLVEKLERAMPADILISHFSLNGSTHLGRITDNSLISRKMLKKFKKTYLGHFHNTHEITEGIVHLPSLIQNNFGEDDNKGFSVIYDDLSYKIINSDFKRFRKFSIDLDTSTSKDVLDLLNMHKNSSDTIRFEFNGSAKKLKTLDKSIFNDSGIDIKLSYEKTFDISELDLPEVKDKHDEKSVLKNFEDFCKKKELNIVDGKNRLIKFLKNE